jgi:epsilon-lactone hydrolase
MSISLYLPQSGQKWQRVAGLPSRHNSRRNVTRLLQCPKKPKAVGTATLINGKNIQGLENTMQVDDTLESATTPADLNAKPLDIHYRELTLSFRTRLILGFMRIFMKPMLAFIFKAHPERIAKMQLQVSSMRCSNTEGLPLTYDLVDRVPGHIFGKLGDTSRPVVLWLHGGAFILPAAPNAHLFMVAKLCKGLDADGFLPDYRLAPFNPFPAGLDDCELAYRSLLDMGYPPSKIVLGGDSAGGNFTLALLHRIKKTGLPMPACAIPVSPVTELGRLHNPPSRPRVRKKDPLLPVSGMQSIGNFYAEGQDTANPEISPLYMDCSGLPPLLFVASSNEILMDDAVMMARRTHAAGVPTSCQIWPHLPHAFPLFESYFPEATQARIEIAEFAKQHLNATNQ